MKQDALSQVIYSLMSSTWRMPNYEYSFKTEDVRFFGLNTNCPFASERLRRKINQDDMLYANNKEKTVDFSIWAPTNLFKWNTWRCRFT